MTQFKTGDTVEWTSQAGGRTRTKRGEVVAIIPAGDFPYSDGLRRWLGQDYKRHYSDSTLGWGDKRKEESYLVAVASKSGRGRRKLYWPRVAALKGVGQ